MKVLFDTNVVLDMMLDRAPFNQAAKKLISESGYGRINGFIASTSIMTIDYLLSKHTNRSKSREEIQALLSIVQIASVNQKTIQLALESNIRDLEDAIIAAAAEGVAANMIATRDVRGFKGSNVMAYSPEMLLAMFEAGSN